MREKFSEKELNQGIFQPNPDEPIEEEPNVNTVVYTYWGKEDGVHGVFPILKDDVDQDGSVIKKAEDKEHAFAKRTDQNFYVKGDGGQLADPFGLYDKDIFKRIGDHKVVRWQPVGHKTFELYIRYLKNKNRTYYANAAREMF